VSEPAEFKYDVAFSFLAVDEGLALDLGNVLRNRLSVFVYSERQKDLAGKDGEAAFGAVFGQDSRVVVILYRKGWGQTKWTRIEETAIRNRGFEEGYDFVILVALEPHPEIPRWLPKNRLWVGFDRWGIDGAAAAIEARVQEVGGAVETQSELERIVAAERIKMENSNFLESPEAPGIAADQFRDFIDALSHLVDKMTSELPGVLVKLIHNPQRHLVSVHGGTHEMHISWSQQFVNTLQYLGLHLRVYRCPRRPEANPLVNQRFDIAMRAGRVVWCEDGGGAAFSSQRLAERCLADFLRHVLQEPHR